MFFNLIIIAENRLEWKGFRLEEFSCIVQESWCRLNTHSAERLFKYDYPINMKENPIVEYFKSAWEEFGKITWPTKEQAALLTGVVIVVSIVISIMIGLVDFGFSEAYQFILDLI